MARSRWESRLLPQRRAREIARAAEDAAGSRLLFAEIGLVGLVVVWVAWSGRWRSWPNSPQTF